MVRSMRFALAIAVLAMLPIGSHAAGVRYVPTDLGTLGGSSSWARGINDAGQVVGTSHTASGEEHAFLWQDGVMTDLGTLGGDWSEAYGINNAGQVVGQAATASGAGHAFLWQGGAMRDLGTLGGPYSGAYGINDAGQVVGSAYTASYVGHAFLWQGGAMRDLVTLDGYTGSANGINNAGQAVGVAACAGAGYVPDAFLWQGGAMRDLGTGGYSYAYGINDSGQVVGSSPPASGYDYKHAFLWQGGVVRDLGTLLGGGISEAWGINNAGQVVGSAYTASGDRHALMWQGGVMRDLGGGNAVALGINNVGQVVGVMTSAGGAQHACLWSPGGKPAVVLVRGLQPHGTTNAETYWAAAKNALDPDFDVWVCDTVTGKDRVGLEAARLSDFIKGKIAQEGSQGIPAPKSISIVAHSYGGLITRKFLHDYCDSAGRLPLQGGAKTKIDKVVMLSGVNCGSLLADIDFVLPWLPHLLSNGGAIDCLMPGYVQNVFNVKECPDLHPRAPYHLFGGDGGNHGLYAVPWSILYGGLPPLNGNDGAVTVRSAHGVRWGWLHWEKQVGGSEYTTNDDHSSIITNANTLVQVKAILLGENVPTTQSLAPQLSGESETTSAVLALDNGSILPSAATQIPVTVDDCPQVSFSLSHDGDAIDFTLTTPANATISPTTSDPNVHYTQTSEQGYIQEVYVIDSPEVGAWSANLSCAGGGTTGAQWIFAATEASELGITGTTAYFQPAGNALLSAAVSDGSQPFSGALVYADVRRPDETTDRVYLYDDGIHQDGAAGDGTYANLYTQCTTPGGYNARYTATGANSHGHTFSRISGGSFQTNPQTATLSATYSDHGEDTGPPAGIEKIIVDVGVQVSAVGKYSVSAKLANSEGAELSATASGSAELAVGSATLSLPFDTEPLRTCGFDGPYKLIDVALWDDSGYQNTGLDSNTTYSYQVSALDASGNESAKGNTASAATQFATEYILDEDVAVKVSSWISSTASGYAGDYIWGSSTVTDMRSVKWTPDFDVSGMYDVYACWVQDTNRSTVSPFTVAYSGGSVTVQANQTQNGQSGSTIKWNLLASYKPFQAGTTGYVILNSGTGVTGTVLVADAVRFVYRGVLDTQAPTVELALRTDYAANPYVTSEYHRSEFSDNCPPQRVDNLFVKDVDCDSGSITLGWTAPDSEGAPAASYDIRYSTEALDAGNWSTATAGANPPVPVAPGSSQSFATSSLAPGAMYYFGIKSRDQAGNESALSNIAEIYLGTVDVRNAGNGTYGGVFATVTASVEGMPGAYVESQDRAWGVRLDASGLEEGRRIYVTGSLQTVDGERVLMWPKVFGLGTIDSLRPLGIGCRSLSAGGGLAPDCLLVRAWGAYTKVDDSTFTVSDGGAETKCIVPSSVTLEQGWTFVAVTGIASTEKVGDVVSRVLRVRRQEDIMPF